MKILKLINLSICLLVVGVLITSCEKESITENDSIKYKSLDENLSSLLAKYPDEVTIDNWEQFVYATKEVIDHFSKLEIENQTRLSNQIQSIEHPEINSRSSDIGGMVRIFTDGTWTNIGGVDVSFINGCSYTTSTTNDSGNNYFFPNNCANAQAAMSSTINLTNGLSTVDLVLMQKHILGLQIFLDARQYLAADTNRDGSISGADLVILRKVIRGIDSNFPVNDIVFVADFLYNIVQDEVNNGNAYVHPLILEQAGRSYLFEVDSPIERNRRAIKTGDVNGSYNL